MGSTSALLWKLSISCYLLFALLSACGFVQQVESFEIVVHFDGNITLPEPGLINTFLGLNTNLSNPLLPGTPLQLQRCTSSIYSTPVDFYTLQHPSGCEKAPGLIKESRKTFQREAEKIVWISALGALGVTSVWTLLRKYSPASTRKFGPWPLFPAKLPLNKSGCHKSYIKLWTWLPFFSTVPAPWLYLNVIAPSSAHRAPLPDPVNINRLLVNQNLTLYLCNIRYVFDVYIGLADSCEQVQGTFFPGEGGNLRPLAHGIGMTLLFYLASIIAGPAWLYYAMGLLYQGFFAAYRCCFDKRKEYYTEMQPPAGSAV